MKFTSPISDPHKPPHRKMHCTHFSPNRRRTSEMSNNSTKKSEQYDNSVFAWISFSALPHPTARILTEICPKFSSSAAQRVHVGSKNSTAICWVVLGGREFEFDCAFKVDFLFFSGKEYRICSTFHFAVVETSQPKHRSLSLWNYWMVQEIRNAYFLHPEVPLVSRITEDLFDYVSSTFDENRFRHFLSFCRRARKWFEIFWCLQNNL